VEEKTLEITLHPIGIIHSPYTEKAGMPIQASRSTTRGSVEVYPEYQDGLEGLEGFSHIFLLYAFHRSEGFKLKIKPFLDDHLHGVFATRYPYRPNPIGFSIVHILSVTGNQLFVEGLDVLDGTPLLDIKPYVPDFDIRTGTLNGWYDSRSSTV
jgi:tRNA-Thr(GGU) m(6)t(6)A37 methyltransferase TsaA